MKTRGLQFLALCLSHLAIQVTAQPAPSETAPATAPTAPREMVTVETVDGPKPVDRSVYDRLNAERTTNFLDYLGVGLSLTIDLGDHDRVEDASIVNGIVRINDDSNVRPRFMGELHFALKCENPAILVDGEKRCNPYERSGGLFVAVLPGSENIVEAVGLGWMWRLPDKLADRALNIGLGIVVDENVEVLGEGFEPNMPPPPGETEIRTQITDQTGFLMMVSLEMGDDR